MEVKETWITSMPIVDTEIKEYKYMDRGDITEVDIPYGTITIGARAFFGCKNLKRLTIPDTVTYIGESAFSGCESLEEIVLPKNLKKLNYRTFADCKNLKKVIIPEGLEELDWAIFSGCESLEEIVLPASIKKLNTQLFLNCKNLKKITLPPNLKNLPDAFFKGCKKLDIVLDEQITELGNRVFEDCYKLSTYPTQVIKAGENCFKNCKGLEKVVLNENMKKLPDGMFDGCINLSDITFNGDDTIAIGERCFKDCISITDIPDFVGNFNVRTFENCTGLSEVTIVDSKVPFGCFKDCKNISVINGQEKILELEQGAFAGCESLEKFETYNLTEVPDGAFKDCINLKEVKLNSGIYKIGSMAFLNCHSLATINLPDTIERIGRKVFKNCNSIKEITIPANLKSFESEAFAYMDSLECINVSPYNETFITPDGKTLIHIPHQKLVLYASGCKDKAYSLSSSYCYRNDILAREIVTPIKGIGKYAFAGAKNLEELTLPSCTEDVEDDVFEGCENLKKLTIEIIPGYSACGLRIRHNGEHYDEDRAKKTPYIPFETVEFSGDLTQIYSDALKCFKNVKTLILPSEGAYSIHDSAFKDCELLEEVNIPNAVFSVKKEAFHPNTKLVFENGLSSKDFVSLNKDNEYGISYKLYRINDGTYHIEQDGKITTISKKYINDVCLHPEEICDNPVSFLDFMNSLLDHDLGIKMLFNGILMNNLDKDGRKIFFKHINKDDSFALKVLKHSGILEVNDECTQELLKHDNFKKFGTYVKLLKEYGIKDKFLFYKPFIAVSDNPLLIELLKVFDANLKRLLKNSKVLENMATAKDNLNDLLTLLKITGALEEDEIARQRASTFITEKMFDETLPTGKNNEFRIVGDDIHRVFNFPFINEEFDEEFYGFFLENYQALMAEERVKSGFIQRVYTNFKEISKTSTSDKGEQRHLKVTLEKCKNYLLTIKFDNVTEENKEFAELIGAWFDKNDIWINAQKVYQESLSAPRNIFTKVTIDEKDNPVYDNDPEQDLKEDYSENFSFEWLPKQDYDNLLLGKYCSCCAHINGQGMGIMRASMILDNCQNLVIRNNFGQIISKSTLYVNKEEGYAVFNNVETSLEHKTHEELEKIYNAFLRGANAFVDRYNENNPEKPITIVTVGENRNTILDYLSLEEHPSVEVKKALHYGGYSLKDRGYNGDWYSKQRLVIER